MTMPLLPLAVTGALAAGATALACQLTPVLTGADPA